MKDNPLKKPEVFGLSLWLDCIRCDLMTGDELRKLTEDEGLAKSIQSLITNAIRDKKSHPSEYKLDIKHNNERIRSGHHPVCGYRRRFAHRWLES